MKLHALAPLLTLALALYVLGADGAIPAEHPKNREFITRMIERLPVGEREKLRSACKNYDKKCPLWGIVEFGDEACIMLREGKSRQQILKGMAGFFRESEDKALVDTAIEVICPEYRKNIRP